jgi:hypothetical protein
MHTVLARLFPPQIPQMSIAEGLNLQTPSHPTDADILIYGVVPVQSQVPVLGRFVPPHTPQSSNFKGLLLHLPSQPIDALQRLLHPILPRQQIKSESKIGTVFGLG